MQLQLFRQDVEVGFCGWRSLDTLEAWQGDLVGLIPRINWEALPRVVSIKQTQTQSDNPPPLYPLRQDQNIHITNFISIKQTSPFYLLDHLLLVPLPKSLTSYTHTE